MYLDNISFTVFKSGSNKSGEYGGCFKAIVLCLARYFLTTNSLCAGTFRADETRCFMPIMKTFMPFINLSFLQCPLPYASSIIRNVSEGDLSSKTKKILFTCDSIADIIECDESAGENKQLTIRTIAKMRELALKCYKCYQLQKLKYPMWYYSFKEIIRFRELYEATTQAHM
jgi:hypothetical protein